MNLVRIAARVAGSSQLVLNGPFRKSEPEESVDIDAKFGFGGAILPLIVKDLGFEGPQFEEERQDLENGPAGDVSVGYEVEAANHLKGERQTWHNPGTPDEFELIIKITHVMGYELTGEDQKAADSMLNQIVHDAVVDDEAEKAMGEPDFDDYGDY